MGYFELGPSTGITGGAEIKIVSAIDLESLQSDMECERSEVEYNLVVEARDNGDPALSTSTNISIRVEDINDNTPTFVRMVDTNVEVPEFSPAGYVITEVSAEDLDA